MLNAVDPGQLIACLDGIAGAGKVITAHALPELGDRRVTRALRELHGSATPPSRSAGVVAEPLDE